MFVFTSNTTFAGDGDKWDTVTGTTKTGEDRYIESASTNGAKTNLNYSQSSNPGKVYIDTQSSFTVYSNSTFNLSVQTTDAMKWCHAIVFFDWNGDGTFEAQSERIGGENQQNDIVKDFSIDITVPSDAAIGETRMRIQITDAWHKNSDPNHGVGHTHSATDVIDKGGCYDFIMNIEKLPTRKVSIISAGNGSVSITNPTEGVIGNSITTNKPVTVKATANDKYEFTWWSDDNGNIVSTENPFIYTGGNDITLTANFNYGPYPEMKRKYQAANQQNRYLKKVSYIIGNEEKTVFEATTQTELPYTAMPTPVTTATTVGALIDKTTTKIVLPQGTTEFKMKFNAWTPQINDNNQELVWTSQAYYIDFDHSLSFEGNTDGVNEISDIAGSSGDNNNFGDSTGSADNGWTRTITLPSNLAPDTYRMRVVYYDGSNWNTSLFTTLNGTIQSGIAYDFDIVIEGTEPAVRTVTVNANPAEGGSVKITSPAGSTENTVETSEPVTVVAEANPGYRFINWTKGDGTSVSTTQEYTYKEINNVTLTANFEKIVNRTIKTIKGALANPGFATGYIVRGNVPTAIIGESTQMTMAAWVNIEGPSSQSIDQGNDNNWSAPGRVVMGTRQYHTTGYGSNPAFAINVCGIDNIKDTYKLGLTIKGIDATFTPIEMPKGWFHLAFTLNYNGTQTTMKMFVNGNYMMQISGNKKYVDLNDFTDICVGDNMNAEFDDIMIWNRELEESEIAASMKGYTDKDLETQTNLVGYFTCDELNEGYATSNNLGLSKSYTFKREKLSYNSATTPYAENGTKSDYSDGAKLSERQTPRGGEKFYRNETTPIEDTDWIKNGDENFGYLDNSQGDLSRLAYNGADKELLSNIDVLAVYHNGNPALPTFVKNSDIITNDDLAVAQVQYSYVVAGLEYTMTMPSVAKTEWMPISLPVDVDLVSDGTYILRPGYNFWYAQVKDDYTSIGSENGIWKTVTSDTKDYVLKPGIISVPGARTGQSFTFYTKLDVPVVIRSFNSEFNKTLMPTPGTIKYIRNPYSYEVNSLNVAGIYPEDGLKGESITVYKYNSASGNFDPVSKEGNINTDPTNRLKAFEPFFVHDSNNGVSQAPRYIGTKDVSGIVEFEAVYDVNVRGTENAVEVETFQNTEVQIYTLDGVMVAADEVEGTREFELPAGIYVVKTTVEGENKSFKVVVE